MKAAILVENKKPLVVTEVEMPKKLEFGQVLVKIFYSGLCGSQVSEIDGLWGEDKNIPHLLGHEGSGVVLDFGPGVKTVLKGDHIVLHYMKSSGIDSPTPKYKWGEKIVSAGGVTTFNTHAIVSENRITKIPKDFDLRLAPVLGCAIPTAMGVINNEAEIKIGQSVVVFGLGGVGLAISQCASLTSAHPIIGIDLHKSKIDLAKKFGVTHGLINNPSIEQDIRSITGNNGADTVIDVTGNSKIIELCYKVTSPVGKTILCGIPKENDNISIFTKPLHFHKTLKGSKGGGSKPDIDIPRYIKLLAAKKVHLDKFITHEYPLEKINEAITTLKSGEAGRIVIKMSHE